jgi:hypothetical protein
MPEELREIAHFRVDVDDETGKHFWRGAGTDDKDETQFDLDEPMVMHPRHFPPGTVVQSFEPEETGTFYLQLLLAQHKPAEPPRTLNAGEWAEKCIEHFRFGRATIDQWEELARIMVVANETGELDAEAGIDEAIRQGK